MPHAAFDHDIDVLQQVDVAQHVAAAVGLSSERVLTGNDLDELHEEALWRV